MAWIKPSKKDMAVTFSCFDEQMMGHSGIILVIMSTILIMVIMRIMCFIVDDSHRKFRKAFILNHDDTLVFWCQLCPSTRLGKHSFKFVLISEILAHD